MTRTIVIALLALGHSISHAEKPVTQTFTPVKTLGAQACFYPASDLKFLGTSRILARGRYTAAVLDISSGKVTELTKPGHEHLIGKSAVGGRRWLASLTPVPRSQRNRKNNTTRFAIWDLDSAKEKTSITCKEQISVFALSHDGEWLVVDNHQQSSLDVYSVRTGKRVEKILDDTNKTRTTHLCFSAYGDSLLQCFKTKNNQHEYRLLRFSKNDFLTDVIHSNKLQSNVREVTTTQAEDTFVFAFSNANAIVRNCSNHESFDTETKNQPIRSIAVDSSGQRMVTSGIDRKIRYWQRRNLEPAKLVRVVDSDGANAIAFSSDGQTVAMSISGRIQAIDFKSGKEINQPKDAATGPLAAVAISPQENRVVAADYAGRLQVWDVASGNLTLLQDNEIGERRFDPWVGPQFAQFSPDGKIILSGSNAAHNVVNLWDAETGERKGFYPGHKWPVMGVDWSGDGSMFASASRDETTRVMNTNGKLIATLKNASMSPVFFPDGKQILAADKYGSSKGLRIFALKTGKLQKTLQQSKTGGRVGGIAMSSDGNFVATTFQCERVVAWDTRKGAVRFDVSLPDRRERGLFGSVSFSPDDQVIAVSLFGRNVWLLNAQTGKVLVGFHAHNAPVTSVTFSKKYLATSSSDFTVKLWDRAKMIASATQQ